jgi:hypothetical protein
MRYGAWNVSSLCRAGSLTAAARKLTRYKIDFVGVQVVRWDKWGTVRAGNYTFLHGKETKNINCEGFMYTKNSISS